MPKVFISYSQEPDAHKARVLALAQALRRDGVEAELDQYHAHRLVNWPRWCLAQLRKADFVLCVCTPEYRDRVYSDEPASTGTGTGKGVHWEGSVLDDEFYDTKGNRRILPLLLMPESGDSIPDFMRGWTYCKLTEPEMSDTGYVQMLRILRAEPAVIPVPVGPGVKLPPSSTSPTTPSAPGTSGLTSGDGAAGKGPSQKWWLIGLIGLAVLLLAGGGWWFGRGNDSVQASNGGVAIRGNVSGTTITTGGAQTGK